MEKILYTRAEAAKMLGISTISVEKLCKSGQLPTVKIGRLPRINAEVLNEFAQAGTANRRADGRPLDELWQTKRK